MDMDAAVDDVLQLNVDVVAVRLPVGDIEPVLIRRVVDDLEDAVEAARLVTWIDRKRCREVFERRFGAPRMAREYVAVYEALLDRCERPEAVLAHP